MTKQHEKAAFVCKKIGGLDDPVFKKRARWKFNVAFLSYVFESDSGYSTPTAAAVSPLSLSGKNSHERKNTSAFAYRADAYAQWKVCVFESGESFFLRETDGC